jgi:hypothetical protein
MVETRSMARARMMQIEGKDDQGNRYASIDELVGKSKAVWNKKQVDYWDR